jgi:hypothetical protein
MKARVGGRLKSMFVVLPDDRLALNERLPVSAVGALNV